MEKDTGSSEQQLARYVSGNLQPVLNDLEVIENVIYLLQHDDASVSGKELVEMLASASQHASGLIKPLFFRMREMAYGTPTAPPGKS